MRQLDSYIQPKAKSIVTMTAIRVQKSNQCW